MCKVTREDMFAAAATVTDPEVGFNLVAMGLIYDATIDENCNAQITMTLSSRGCPLSNLITGWVKEAIEKIEAVNEASVEVVWEPEWNISMADDEVRKALMG